MKLNHLEQICWAFRGDDPALGALLAEAIKDSCQLEPIEDGDTALALIESKGLDAAKRAAIGDYFWHPKCAKCDRCRRHRPECGYDKRAGREKLICNRCREVLS